MEARFSFSVITSLFPLELLHPANPFTLYAGKLVDYVYLYIYLYLVLILHMFIRETHMMGKQNKNNMNSQMKEKVLVQSKCEITVECRDTMLPI